MQSFAFLFLFIINPNQLFHFPLMPVHQLLQLLQSYFFILINFFIASALHNQDLVWVLAFEFSHHCLDIWLPKFLVLVREVYLSFGDFCFDPLSFDEIATWNCLVLLVFQMKEFFIGWIVEGKCDFYLLEILVLDNWNSTLSRLYLSILLLIC